MHNKILLIGISGTGKSHLARRLSTKLDLPVVFLDTIFWKDNWQEEDPTIVESKIHQALSQDKWIIEGYIEPLGKERIQAADLVLYLDYPGYVAMWGGLKRWWQHRGKARPEMPSTNIEKFGWRFLWSLLRREERPEIEAAIQSSSADAHRIVRLHSRRATKKYVASLASRNLDV